VRVTCQAEVYNTDEVQAKVSAQLGQEATTLLATGYTIQGEVTANRSTITTVDARHGIIALHIQAEGVWAYQLSAAQLHALAALVAGKPLWQAQTILLHTQNIHQVSISSTDWWDDANQQAPPQDPNRIRVTAISWAGV
jgi:VCBS repeat-containing protein